MNVLQPNLGLGCPSYSCHVLMRCSISSLEMTRPFLESSRPRSTMRANATSRIISSYEASSGWDSMTSLILSLTADIFFSSLSGIRPLRRAPVRLTRLGSSASTFVFSRASPALTGSHVEFYGFSIIRHPARPAGPRPLRVQRLVGHSTPPLAVTEVVRHARQPRSRPFFLLRARRNGKDSR